MNTVIGLEVHVQLNTERKVFGTEAYAFGEEPNSCVSPITMAHPGALPSLNRACVEKVIQLGLALKCRINPESRFARKNYFYPDLPKGYQMSQDALPICEDGFLELEMPDGSVRRMGITRIHLEEDAGKLIHDREPRTSVVDLNRAGVGLAEIVTEPDMRSPEEASLFLAEIRRLVRYLDVGDGDMEKGNLRCDANVSIRESEEAPLGTRAEVKNLNSFSFLEKAIQYEQKRQWQRLQKGEAVIQETRTFDPATGQTGTMRDKEDAEDYRYFPEPDLPPLELTDAMVASIREAMPELPWERRKRYRETCNLPEGIVQPLVDRLDWGQYFDALVASGTDPKIAANWLTGPLASWANNTGNTLDAFPVSPEKLQALIGLVDSGKVTLQNARGSLLDSLVENPGVDPATLLQQLGLAMENNEDALVAAVRELADEFPAEVARFKNGDRKLQGFFIGQLMRKLKGKADAKTLGALLREHL